MITCDEIIDTAKAVATNFKKIKVTCKKKKLAYFACLFINYYNVICSC